MTPEYIIKRFDFFHFFTIKFIFLLLILFASCTSITSQTKKIPYQDIQLPQPNFFSPKSTVDLFVMSHCPYGIEAEKAIISVIKDFQNQIDFHLYFIAEKVDEENSMDSHLADQENLDPYQEEISGRCIGKGISEGGRYKSLHGKEEVEEDIRQTVIERYYPQKFLDYLLFRAESYQEPDWEQAAVSAWIDCDRIKQLVQEGGEKLFLKNIQKAKEMKIYAAPTLFINGKKFRGPINRWSIARGFCREGYHPQKCQDVPVCGRDSDCRTGGRVGVCSNPDTSQARCRFTDPVKVKLEIIQATDCSFCGHKPFRKWIKEQFPGIETVEINPNSSAGKNLLKEYSIKALPAYIFDPNIQKTARYSKIKEALRHGKDRFLFSEDQLYITSLLYRPLQKDRLALFTEGFSSQGLMAVKKLIQMDIPILVDFEFHPLAGVVNQQEKPGAHVLDLVPTKGGDLILAPHTPRITFKAPGGLKEIQEDIRQLCMAKYFPEHFIPYIKCLTDFTVTEIEKGKWQDCLEKIDLQEKELKSCTHAKEAVDLLLHEIDLSKNLGIQKGPAYLINNKILLRKAPPELAVQIYSKLNGWE